MFKLKYLFSSKQHSCAGHDILISKSVYSTNNKRYNTFKANSDHIIPCYSINNNNISSSESITKQQSEIIKFRCNVPGFKTDEQPIFSIQMLNSLNPSVV
ncbi:hypothetical protein A0H76_1341 [Hepatospora eriocheir]|uniref:Uncharacterized protein n=1 Tax=Hepatospora eriocheir TaxID=1081669 RepID=A0A1X0QHH8_9MICR|nr:hypothetical protein A0H76_1341 [Hepatospora eriocheir]